MFARWRLCPTSIFPSDPWTLVMQRDLFAVGDCEPRKIIAHLHGIFISWYLSMFLTCPDHGMMMMMITHTHTYIYIIMVMYIHRYPHIRYLPTNTPHMCSTYAFTLFGIIESQRADDQRDFWHCDKKVSSNDYLSCSLTFWLTDGLWTMKQDDLQHLLSKSQFQHLQWPSGRCHSGTRRFRATIRHPWSSMWAIWVICRRPVASRFFSSCSSQGCIIAGSFFGTSTGNGSFFTRSPVQVQKSCSPDLCIIIADFFLIFFLCL